MTETMVTIQNEYFSIPQICDSGQCFRMEKTGDHVYELVAGNRYLKIRTEENETVLECTREEYEEFWKSYFDLESRYEDYISGIDEHDAYLKEAAAFGKGIRILRQDVWEMIITFILSQQNNIPRIKGMIRALSRRYGRKIEMPDGIIFDAFPEPQGLAEATEEELREMKFGYRSRYIVGTAKKITSGEVNLEEIAEMDYPQARNELMKLPGVGGKVADCICLFALHQLGAFPVDTHIRQVLNARYEKGFPFERYRGFAGVLQQYIFYFDLKGEK